MSLHMNESALRPTIKELFHNHITDSNEKGRLKSWAKVYEADRKSLWKPLSTSVSGLHCTCSSEMNMVALLKDQLNIYVIYVNWK